MSESRLAIQDQKLTVAGSPPYRIESTVRAAEAFLALPPLAAPGKPSISDLLTKINPIDLRKLMTVIDTDRDLRTAFDLLKQSYCGIASPGSISWPVPKPDEILDEVALLLGPIRAVICTIDGLRLIACVQAGVPRLITLEEFEIIFNATFEDIVRNEAKQSAVAIRQVATICKSRPITYEVSMIDNEFRAITKLVRAYSRDQIDRYAARNKQTITDVAPKE